MKHTSTWILIGTFILLGAAAMLMQGCQSAEGAQKKTPAAKKVVVVPVTEVRKDVDVAICLDTSGSMDGLIESAKQKLWAIVNELATAKPRPRLRVALYHYGNDGLNSETGWVKRLCPLTDDLDLVYEKLFELKTNGGTEYVARVVRAATMDLSWSTQKGAMKMIVVAGNEAATQDAKTYKLADICKQTISKGIVVNTIFCGAEREGRNSGWADAAHWADGQYAAIDQNKGTVVIVTPHDKKLAELSTELNKTYVGYGAKGKSGKMRQVAQDANANKLSPSSSSQRASAKASGLYSNAGWDLVDAERDGKVDLGKIPATQLPKEMQKMNVAERKKYVETMQTRRSGVQKQIKDLAKKQAAYQKKEMEKRGLDESNSFDANLRKAIRVQGKKSGMTFEAK